MDDIFKAAGFTEIARSELIGGKWIDKRLDTMLAKIEPTISSDQPPGPADLIPVSASAAYALADALERDIAMYGEVAVWTQGDGDSLFGDDVLDAMHAAGITVRETRDGIVIDLPNGPWSIDGRTLRQTLSKPLTAADLAPFELDRPAPPAHDYLRHDPTKQHRRRRKRR